MEWVLGWKGIVKIILISFLTGGVIFNFAKDHWTTILLAQPFWVVPIWFYVVLIAIPCIYILFSGGHHD